MNIPNQDNLQLVQKWPTSAVVIVVAATMYQEVQFLTTGNSVFDYKKPKDWELKTKDWTLKIQYMSSLTYNQLPYLCAH